MLRRINSLLNEVDVQEIALVKRWLKYFSVFICRFENIPDWSSADLLPSRIFRQ